MGRPLNSLLPCRSGSTATKRPPQVPVLYACPRRLSWAEGRDALAMIASHGNYYVQPQILISWVSNLPRSSMSEGHERYLHEQLTTAHAKHTYFLLAVAASAIALVVKQTEDSALALTQIPLGMSVFSWGLSFYAGCRRIQWSSASIRANLGLSLIQQGLDPTVPDHPDARRAAIEGTREAADENSEGAGRTAKWQFRFLIAGAVFYLAWHVLGMIERTPGLRGKLGF